MLSPERLTNDEYEKQYFGFSTTDLVEDFKNVIKNILQNTLTDLEQEIVKSGYPEDPLKKAIDELYLLYMESAQIAIQKFEVECTKIFAIPKNVLLAEDKIKCLETSHEEIKLLQKDVEELEKELIREKVFLAKLQQMKELFESDIEPTYKKITDLFTVGAEIKKSRENPNKLVDLFIKKAQQFVGSTEGSQIETIVRLSKTKRNFFDH